MWEKSNQGGVIVHVLPIDDTAVFEVYKTAGGDYAMVCFKDGDPCGGDPEYFDTLRDAKATAERIIASGNYEAYTLDSTSALA
jgi:hypothetical protein